MAFFEDLGKKITQTGQGVVQKTKDTAEVIKLNGMISDEERRINALYVQIGQKYVELHATACEPAMAGFVREIKEAQARIAEHSEQVKRLKGIARCPHCGGDVPYGAPFCSSCGGRMETVSQQSTGVDPSVRRCSSCGMPLADGCAFCTHCGTRVEEAPPAPPQPPAPRVCPGCGCEVADDSAFCMNCGTPVK